jgi:hypothetical protein
MVQHESLIVEVQQNEYQASQSNLNLSRLTFLRYLSFFKGSLLPNLKKNMVQHEPLIVEVQQLEDIFSILRTDLCAPFKILGVGANDVSAERRKTGDFKITLHVMALMLFMCLFHLPLQLFIIYERESES